MDYAAFCYLVGNWFCGEIMECRIGLKSRKREQILLISRILMGRGISFHDNSSVVKSFTRNSGILSTNFKDSISICNGTEVKSISIYNPSIFKRIFQF